MASSGWMDRMEEPRVLLTWALQIAQFIPLLKVGFSYPTDHTVG